MLFMKTKWIVSLNLALITGAPIWAASIDEVTFLSRIQVYETVTNTTLVTQEGKRIPLDRGMRVNVAGFTETEALVISRSDRPNGFIRKADITPAFAPSTVDSPRIREETLPRQDQSPGEVTR
jgi:hypothetical protein